MKKNVLMAVFLAFSVVSAYSRGKLELVNTQEISLDQKNVINILYRDENISLLKGNSDALIIKEYMTEGKEKYYARINDSGNTVSIEVGHRPVRPYPVMFKARVEIYLPESYRSEVNIKTTDGKIDVPNEISGVNLRFNSKDGDITVSTVTAEMIDIKSSDGDITINAIMAEMINLKSSDGNIRCEYINGNVSAESSDGKIELVSANGRVNAKTSDGSIRCTVKDNVGNISLISRDGNVQLNLPEDLVFRFSARTSDGRLSTPFADRLFSPLNDRKLAEGVVGGDDISEDSPRISITTKDGSIKVNWLN
jgi:lia operon protein LiaG